MGHKIYSCCISHSFFFFFREPFATFIPFTPSPLGLWRRNMQQYAVGASKFLLLKLLTIVSQSGMPGQHAPEIPGGLDKGQFLNYAPQQVSVWEIDNQAPLVNFVQELSRTCLKLYLIIGRDKPTNLECRARIIIKYAHFNLSKPMQQSVRSRQRRRKFPSASSQR